MLIAGGTIRLTPENLQRARPVMAAVIAATRAEDGCIDYAYAEDLVDPGLIRIWEVWRDREALGRHLKTAHMKVWRDAWADLGVHDRQLAAYETEGPAAF